MGCNQLVSSSKLEGIACHENFHNLYKKFIWEVTRYFFIVFYDPIGNGFRSFYTVDVDSFMKVGEKDARNLEVLSTPVGVLLVLRHK